jgi:hypothetical protein
MGLDPIQHQLTLSIVCAVQASGCFLISRAVAKLRSDWQRPIGGVTPLVQNRLGQDRLVQDLASIAPQAHHQFDLQVWDQQFAQAMHPPIEPLPKRIGAELQDPWDERVRNELPVEDVAVEELTGEDLPIEDLPIKSLPIEDLPIEDLPVEGLPVTESSIAPLAVPAPLPKPVADSPVADSPLEQPALNTLFALTVPQLRSHAKQLGLKNYSRQTKAQLLVAIRRQLEGVT